MGVLGLIPFLQKTCPEVVRSLPDRLESLKGKRIVIDGTLITQRFHFAPSPQRYRHVLAWYRLAKQLQDMDIRVLCVFDGSQRHPAKAAEIEKRRLDRIKTAIRGKFETKRFTRLTQSVQVLRSLQVNEHERYLGALRTHLDDWKALDVLDSQFFLGLHLVSSLSFMGAPPPLSSPATNAMSNLAESLQGTTPVADEKDDHGLGSTTSPESPLAVIITKLREEFHQNTPQLAPSSTAMFPPDFSFPVSTQEEYTLSKSQQGLTVEEDKLWNQTALSAWESVAGLVESLQVKSGVLSESYRRRMRPPTPQTYQESREVLCAMGIPCIEPCGKFEAEALASSLVVNGYADYVASEDTDVLVYDAPLIRNIASQEGPLTIIFSQEARAALDLDRPQFIDLALLLGTDFSQRIKQLGPIRALKLIREYGSIERIVENEAKYTPQLPREEYLAQIKLARLVFQTLPPVPDKDKAILQQPFENRQEDGVLAVLEKYNISRYAALDDWDHGDPSIQSLSGNYFADNPAAA